MNAAAAAALTACALLACASPAVADPDKTKKPEPPAEMSAVGGERLAKAGTQVSLGQGAPKTPGGLTARSWIVADAESGDVLAAHNAHWELAPASTLKMLFADTVLPKLDKDEEHKVTLEELAKVEPGSSLVGIKEDHTYTVHDMWLGVFLASGNDAVHVLSEMNGGVSKTVDEMQKHAEDLQANDTYVVSPDGFDEPGQVSSAYDLTLFARSGLQKPDFREYCATATAKFPGKFKGKGKKKKRESYAIQNTNRLLVGSHGLAPYEGIAGVKNGYTSEAGNTFTGVAERDGRTLLVTVMHPESGGNTVYEESAKLLDWGFEAADEVEPVGKLVPPKSAQQAAGNPGQGKGKQRDGISASGPQPGATVGTEGSDGIWSALGLAGAALLLVAGTAVLVHRRWPLPALVSGVRTRLAESTPGPTPEPAPEPDPEQEAKAATPDPEPDAEPEAKPEAEAEADPSPGTEPESPEERPERDPKPPTG